MAFWVFSCFNYSINGILICSWKDWAYLFNPHIVSRITLSDCRYHYGNCCSIVKNSLSEINTFVGRIALIGFFQTAGVMGCIFVSLRTITAGQSSILTFMNPLLVVIFGTLFMKLSYSPRQWFGVILGFIGVFITLGASL